MCEIREVIAADHFDDLVEITALNWDEVGYPYPLKLDRDYMRQLQDSGFWFALIAFDGEHIVGYATASIVPHPYNYEVAVCSSDAIFVRPEYRKGVVSARLMQETERVAKERGAHLMLWETRYGTGLAEDLARHGYTPTEIVVMKEL